METEGATFTGDRINLGVLDSLKATQLLAQPTLGAPLVIYDGNLPAPELMVFLNQGIEKEVKVSSVDITVHQHLAIS